MKNLTLIFVSFVSFVSFCSISSFAQAPLQFTYQGRLTDSDGIPITSTVTGIFRIVKGGDVMAGGQVVYAQTNNVTPDVNGVFSVVLGSVPIAAIADGTFSNRYIEAVVNGETNLPRQQVLSVPYAIQAIVADLPGTVKLFAGANIPSGWHLCHGQSLDRIVYAPLFEAIGTNFGFANASTFKVPDLRGRVPMGAGQGSGLSNRVLAETVGAETHALTLAQMPRHNHSRGTFHYGGEPNNPGTRLNASGPNTAYYSNGGVGYTVDSGGTSFEGGIAEYAYGNSEPHPIIQPSLVLNYIIKD